MTDDILNTLADECVHQCDCEREEAIDSAWGYVEALQKAGFVIERDWQPIETAPMNATEIIGENERGRIERTWFFAPSRDTRNWLRFSDNRPWNPIRWRPAPPRPTLDLIGSDGNPVKAPAMESGDV